MNFRSRVVRAMQNFRNGGDPVQLYCTPNCARAAELFFLALLGRCYCTECRVRGKYCAGVPAERDEADAGSVDALDALLLFFGHGTLAVRAALRRSRLYRRYRI